MISQTMAAADESIYFIWQGGEPTLMGLDFFKQAVSFQHKLNPGIQVANGMQTNGLLVDREWSRFFKQNQFLVGLSLDGPEAVHNRSRKHKGGQGTYKKVLDTCNRMLDDGVEVNVLTLVNSHSVAYAQEIYEHHKHLGLNHMQFVPHIEDNAQAFGDFLIQLFDLWIADFNGLTATTSIRWFDALFYHYVNRKPPECTLCETCGDYLVVEHNGAVYPCDFFVEPQWQLGNLQAQDLLTLLNSPKAVNFTRLKTDLPDSCLSCPWKSKCFGGCPKDRTNHQSNRLCKGLKAFFLHADPLFKKLARQFNSR